MICASCPRDLAGESVVVVRTVIVDSSPARVRICVPCDAVIPLSDLYWYPREDHDRADLA